MVNESDDVDNRINLNIQQHLLKKELNNIKNDLNKEKKINLMSKDYIHVLESKVNDLTIVKENNEELVAENKRIYDKLKTTRKKCYTLSENNESLITKYDILIRENEEISLKLKKSKEACNELSTNYTKLEEKLFSLSEKFDNKEKDVQNLSEEIKILHAENVRLNRLTQTYENSTSWKLTKPFRFLFNKFH